MTTNFFSLGFELAELRTPAIQTLLSSKGLGYQAGV